MSRPAAAEVELCDGAECVFVARREQGAGRRGNQELEEETLKE